MKKFSKAVLVLCVFVCTAAMAMDDREKWDGKWTDIVEGKKEVDIVTHWDVCGIKFRTRQYSDLYKCLDLIDDKAAQTDAGIYLNIRRFTPFFSNWMRFVTYFELGLFAEARTAASAAMRAAPGQDPEAPDYDKSLLQLFNMLKALNKEGRNPAALDYRYEAMVTDLLGGQAIIDVAMNDAAAFDADFAALGAWEPKVIPVQGIYGFTIGKFGFGWHVRKKIAEIEFARGNYAAVMAYYDSILKRQAAPLDPKAKAVLGGVIGLFVAATIISPVSMAASLGWQVGSHMATDHRIFNTAMEYMADTYMLATTLLNTGDVAGARARFDQLLKNKDLVELGGLHWRVLYQRGLVALRDGDPDAAISYFKQSSEAIEKVRSTIAVESAKIGFSGDKQAVYQDLVKSLASKGDWAGAFEYAERAKARALVDMLSQKDRIVVPDGIDPKVVALLERAEYREAPLSILEPDRQVRSAALAAREELNKSAPELASLVSVAPVSLADIAARLAPQETLVNYFNAGDGLYALVLNGESVKGFRLESAGLEGDVRKFRESLEKSDKSVDMQAKALYARLVAPFASELKGRRVTFSPHTALHYLPFGALHDGKQYLVEKYSIRVTPSANALAYVKTDKPRKAGKVLALGNPDLNDNSLDLPAAQKEATQVAALFPASKALVRKEATKEAIKEYGNGFSIVHIASHGEFDAQKPLNSGLLLAGDGPDAGKLTVDDLYSMQLDAELVTLSACETGLGKVASGDDVVGLTRGFLYAGARSVVASLWQVDDAATAKLMTAFYRNLASNMEQREALRLAQVETKKTYPHPFYWAAFQITGAAN